MKRRTAISSALWFLTALVHAQADPILKVRILERSAPEEVLLRASPGKGPWDRVKLTRGQMAVNGKALKRAHWGRPGSGVEVQLKKFTRTYPGNVLISIRKEDGLPELQVLNEVHLRDYLPCVLAVESGFDRSQPEYLIALGAVIRNYALAHRQNHPGYDLCDLTHCQVYQGLPRDPGFWRDLGEAAEGYQPPIPLGSYYFSRCCGGLLGSAAEIGGIHDLARVGPDECEGRILCRSDPLYRWTTHAKAEDLAQVLLGSLGSPSEAELEGLEVIERTPQGRAKTLKASFKLPAGRIDSVLFNAPRFVSRFGKRFGWRVFPSLHFEVEKRKDLFYFSGRGFGHGVGLCQSGAAQLARMGWDSERILGFYFPKR